MGCSAINTRANRTAQEGLMEDVTTGDGGNGNLTGKCCKPSIPVPYIIAQTGIAIEQP